MDDRQQAGVLIRNTLTRIKQFLAQEKPTRLSEADTKAEFIEKYIHALGYEGLEDVVREYYVKNSQEFIDYVLRADGMPVLAIEAKPLQTDLTDKHAAQVIQYCSIEGIEWCALTNARALWLFNTYLKGDQNQKLVVKLDLLSFNSDEEFEAICEQLWLLSKSSLSSPSAINSWMEQRRLDQAMRTILLNQHSQTIKTLVGDLAGTAGVTASPDTAVQWVRGQLAPNISILPPPSVTAPVYQPKTRIPPSGPHYWLMPCGAGDDGAKPLDQLHRWLDRGYWGFAKSTAGRKHLQTGDYVCFYVRKLGISASARIDGTPDTVVTPDEWPEPSPPTHEVYKVPLRYISWLPAPRPLTQPIRAQMEWFQQHDPDTSNFGYFVQTTRSLSPHDFAVLTAEGQTAAKLA